LEFDILDTESNHFLDTPRRHALLTATPFVQSVPVLHTGIVPTYNDLVGKAGPSAFIAEDHLEQLRQQCARLGFDPDLTVRETDPTTLMEGLYIKVEGDGTVTERYKYVRAGFQQTVLDADSHWLDRPIVPNQLRRDTLLF
jgi:hypothetical protein